MQRFSFGSRRHLITQPRDFISLLTRGVPLVRLIGPFTLLGHMRIITAKHESLGSYDGYV